MPSGWEPFVSGHLPVLFQGMGVVMCLGCQHS